MERRIFQELPVVIESPAGSVRQWRDRASGKSGETKMLYDYGYLEGHVGSDGEEVDCYLGPDESAKFVYVVHQLATPDYKRHDEDKVFLGFPNEEAARAAYLSHRSDEEKAYGGMSAVPLDAFRAKLRRRSGTGKIRHEKETQMSERSGAESEQKFVMMRIEKRGSQWVVLPESGDHVLGTHASKKDAEKQLAAIEASKARAAKHEKSGRYISFEGGKWI